MPNKFVISDTHFSHKNSLKFFRKDDPTIPLRPGFASLEEMDETLVSNWNKTVGDNDIVLHCGDFSFGGKQNIAKFARRLRGRKILMMGNHDYNAIDYIQHFDEVKSWHECEEFRVPIVMTHMPLHYSAFSSRFSKAGAINIHGHLHDVLTNEPYHVNVCVENINYTPIAIEEIISNI